MRADKGVVAPELGPDVRKPTRSFIHPDGETDTETSKPGDS